MPARHRDQLSSMAKQAREAMEVEDLSAVADRGDSNVVAGPLEQSERVATEGFE